MDAARAIKIMRLAREAREETNVGRSRAKFVRLASEALEEDRPVKVARPLEEDDEDHSDSAEEEENEEEYAPDSTGVTAFYVGHKDEMLIPAVIIPSLLRQCRGWKKSELDAKRDELQSLIETWDGLYQKELQSDGFVDIITESKRALIEACGKIPDRFAKTIPEKMNGVLDPILLFEFSPTKPPQELGVIMHHLHVREFASRVKLLLQMVPARSAEIDTAFLTVGEAFETICGLTNKKTIQMLAFVNTPACQRARSNIKTLAKAIQLATLGTADKN